MLDKRLTGSESPGAETIKPIQKPESSPARYINYILEDMNMLQGIKKETHFWYECPHTNRSFKLAYSNINELAVEEFEDDTDPQDMDDDTFYKYCEILVSEDMLSDEY